MIKLKKVVHLRRKLIRLNIIFVTAGILVVGFSAFIYIQLSMKVGDLRTKYGKNVQIMDDVHKELKESNAKLAELGEQVVKNAKTKKQHYFDLLAENFYFYYGQYGVKLAPEPRKVIRETIERVFDNVDIMWAKGKCKNIAATPRLVALTELCKYPVESNFDLKCITWNYIREKNTRYLLLFSSQDKAMVESMDGILMDEYKVAADGYIEGNKNGKAFRVKPIGVFKKLIPTEKDIATITMPDKSTVLVKATDFMIKTTRDWGGLQVNDCNLTWGYNQLYKLGLWNQSMDKWILDPDINIQMRLLVDDGRAANGLDKTSCVNSNKTILNVLKNTKGWEGIME